MTKYNSSDNLTTLELSDDAASINLGGSWRMPTEEEYKELLSNTTNTLTTINGVGGILFTSKYNGNTLFFPASGSCQDGGSYGVGSCGRYWSSSINSGPALGLATRLEFLNSCSLNKHVRPHGYTVRGVVY